MKPKRSYTIWFSQRTGSTLLCKALEATGVAGKPGEWLYAPNTSDFLQFYGMKTYTQLQEKLWDLGSTPNGVCGLKFSFYQPLFNNILSLFENFPGCEQNTLTGLDLWEGVFPNTKHFFMMRRNKVRLAVSWWKAIKTQEWHREKGQAPVHADLSDAYSFEAIRHLLLECSMREAGLQEFFSKAGIIPTTLVYEDFILSYDQTIRNMLEILEVTPTNLVIDPPPNERLSDEVSEEWADRFRNELQKDWQNKGW